MRLRVISIVALLLLAIGSVDFQAGVSQSNASTIQSDSAPRIYHARVKGKKLILTGENFMEGAVILVDGERQKTRNDENSPTTTLIAKKAGNRIPDYATVAIQVQAPNGLTDKFPFFKGQVITFEELGKPIILRLGERFLLSLQKATYEFIPSVLDGAILTKVNDVEFQESQGVFEALRVGTTTLVAVGEPLCAKGTPPCLAPALRVEFTVIVE
jgi:hypothetical protein